MKEGRVICSGCRKELPREPSAAEEKKQTEEVR
jgi:hypothetical protein